MNNSVDVPNITLVSVDKLLLDPENPRLASTYVQSAPSQFDLLKVLWTEMAVDELVLSIAANGYFPEEPLFIVPVNPAESSTNQFYVVEGNRRLAAVKILLDDELRKRLRITQMPVLTDTEKAKLRTLPVSIYQSRQSLWAYLSFRHINTPQEWDSYSKAKFVAKIHDEYGVPLEEIARRIGDQNITVLRLYRGYKVLRQAEEDSIYDVSDRYRERFFFSHLYTALTYQQFQEFIGISANDFEKDKPVPTSHYDNLRELLTWLYGSKSAGVEIEPIVVRQNPDLNTLREVLGNQSALDALRSGYSLDRAHEVGIGDERRFREALIRAKSELQQAKATVTTGYLGDDMLLRIVDDIIRIGRTLKDEMEEIRH